MVLMIRVKDFEDKRSETNTLLLHYCDSKSKLLKKPLKSFGPSLVLEQRRRLGFAKTFPGTSLDCLGRFALVTPQLSHSEAVEEAQTHTPDHFFEDALNYKFKMVYLHVNRRIRACARLYIYKYHDSAVSARHVKYGVENRTVEE